MKISITLIFVCISFWASAQTEDTTITVRTIYHMKVSDSVSRDSIVEVVTKTPAPKKMQAIRYAEGIKPIFLSGDITKRYPRLSNFSRDKTPPKKKFN